MKHTPLLALALLVLAPAVYAQQLNLNSGDVVTVDGTGTHGTINNSTTSYGGVSPAVQTNGTAIFTLGAGGTITGVPSGYGLYTNGSGSISITGGTITGGSSGFGLACGGSGSVTVIGGTITAGQYGIGLTATGSERVTINGGTFIGAPSGYGLFAGSGGSITITGGTITTGTDGYGLYTSIGTIDLYGSFTGLTIGQNQSLPSGGTTSSFYGTLVNNSAPATFTYLNYGTITLHDVALAAAPEPSPIAAFAVGLLGLGALAIKAKRRTA